MTKIKGKVVLLPFKGHLNGSEIYNIRGKLRQLVTGGQGRRAVASGFSANHIYIVSDEEIQIGDYQYYPLGNSVIKTCNLLWSEEESCKKVICSTDPNLNLPLIPQEFIQQYCENPIKDVWVEAFDKSDLIPIITPIQEKEYWTRDEVVQCIKDFWRSPLNFSDWINQNL